MENYICKECGKEVKIDKDGSIIRNCNHQSTIILDMKVIVTGEGKTNT